MNNTIERTSYTVTLQADTAVMAETYINVMVTGREAVYQVARQLVENGIDAGATRIDIVLDEKTGTVYVVDNGAGMGLRERQGFHTLHRKVKDGVSTIGQNNSGRIACLAIADEMEILTVSKESGSKESFSFRFTREMVNRMIRGSFMDEKLQIEPLRKKHELAHLIKGETGTVVKLHDVDFTHFPRIETIRQNLPDYFSREIARKIFLNGKALPVPQAQGESLAYREQDPVLGLIDADIFVSQEAAGNSLRFGAKNPIFDSLSVFVRDYIPESAMKFLSEKLFHPQLGGTILIEGLNEFRDHVSNNRLSKTFMGSKKQEATIRVLKVLGKMVEEAFENLENATRVQAERKFRQEVMDVLNPLFQFRFEDLPKLLGESTTPRKEKSSSTPRQGLHLNHVRIEMAPGATQTFRVMGLSGTSGKFRWDISKAGGTLKRKPKLTDREVTYIAGEETGDFVLVVQDADIPELRKEIHICIATEPTMTITPKGVKVMQGTDQPFTLLNAPDGDIEWSLTGKRGLNLKPQTGNKTVLTVSKETPLGEYEIVARCGDKEIRSTFEVTEPPNLGDFVKIEETLYILDAPLAGAEAPFVAQSSRNPKLIEGRFWPVIEVNFDHMVFSKASRPKERLRVLLPALMHAHAMHLVSQGTDPLHAIPKIEELRLKALESLN